MKQIVRLPRMNESVRDLKKRGYTYREIARELHISTDTLRGRLRGNSAWRIDEVFHLAAFAGIPTYELVTGATRDVG